MQLTINIVYHSLLYGAEDPSIAGMVLDSPFSDLVDLMMELVDTYKIRLPKFTVCKSIAPKYIYQCLIVGLQASISFILIMRTVCATQKFHIMHSIIEKSLVAILLLK